ncbi:DNA-binding MarR family transcriptional regulator [Stackebrandtia albiflava]|uniref:DNA-binding MarR family transcriptional regulator n=1 Tax=Stackebrandtia albiflava TaxID=406432 RepID=A0A562V577_9ACTN|nr:MarR family transcriptional regulator [Stackebrandtia albiflava]TWJ13029.1 DNA-binding MarR family transcriptional regulator [Stackebrandtia albiflava]
MTGDALEVLKRLRRLHSQTDLLLDQVAAGYGVNRNDLRCLEIIERDGPLNARALAEAARLSPAAVTKVTDRLVAAGYVVRAVDERDRRAQSLTVSSHHAALRAATWNPLVADLLTALDDGTVDLSGLAALLDRLNTVISAHGARLATEPPAASNPAPQ